MTESKALDTAHKVFLNRCSTMPEREFLLQPIDGELNVITFGDAENQVRRIAAALVALGLNPGDKVAILSKNCAEWILADLAIAMAGLVSVPVYPTANADTIAYILGHCEAKAAFVGKLDDMSVLDDAIPDTLPTISFPYPTIDCRQTWQELISQTEPLAAPHEPAAAEVMTILYTSGSTGRPKGVVISYSAYIYGCNAALSTAEIFESDRIISYLPLAHVVERMAFVGPAIFVGSRIFFTESVATFPHDLKTARPSAFCSVPRLWVNFQSGVHAKIPPEKLRLLLAIPILGKIVARKIRRELGLDECRVFGSGSAPISVHTLTWYEKIGIKIGEGWGMTETCGLSCANLPFQSRRIGTIGTPVDGTELKISEIGELMIRCPGLFTEYYKQPDLTREAFTDDGFFHTGDKADWDEERQGYRITGRVKDIFKTAKGKYVAPVPIESRLSANPLLEQICVIGTGLRAPIAVVVLAEAANNLPEKSVADRLAATLIDTNEHLESHERLSNIFISKDAWTTENDLLTPTLKVKRDQLEARYLEVLNQAFDDAITWEDKLTA